MIDFSSYERVKLIDVADFERAKKGHIYPSGSSTFQISATRGQIGYLDHPQTVKSKDAVITPAAGINGRYFNLILQKNVDEFMHKYATGLNVQLDELGFFPIEICNSETQEAIARMLMFVGDKESEAHDELNYLLELKQALLQRMML
ncbi:restriction endonuclease subunit S [Lactobacillus rhamnosus]|uniref:Restriction endonuclease subunit S n=1 Tax=Lacticaseibacillus rhamnosus TaxID=47715 RepID=A0A7Y7QH06_LACRH|nr:restriction endonuclease subunit S [Lacticaseibacillus rhamnosus]NVO88934.1 restriction endonuclease subunit S [Lacticaseibacillus rhamnosus]